MFKDLNILPFSKLVTQRIGVLMFRYSIHALPSLPCSREDLFTSNIYNAIYIYTHVYIYNILQLIVSTQIIQQIEIKTTKKYIIYYIYIYIYIYI